LQKRRDVISAAVHGHRTPRRLRKYFTPPPFELVGNETVSKFTNTTGAPAVTQDNTPLPERANYLDVGVNQLVIPGLTVGLDSYYKTSHDLIDEGQFGAPIILTPFNYKDGRQYGAEFTTNYLSPTFNAYANLGLQHAVGKDIITSQFNFSQDDLNYIANHYVDLDHEQHFTASGGVSYLRDRTRISADILIGSGLRATPPGGPPNGAHLPYDTQTNLGLQHSFDIAGGTDCTFRRDQCL
jgi:outer membrane receptor for ferrienterochelin and colicins